MLEELYTNKAQGAQQGRASSRGTVGEKMVLEVMGWPGRWAFLFSQHFISLFLFITLVYPDTSMADSSSSCHSTRDES